MEPDVDEVRVIDPAAVLAAARSIASALDEGEVLSSTFGAVTRFVPGAAVALRFYGSGAAGEQVAADGTRRAAPVGGDHLLSDVAASAGQPVYLPSASSADLVGSWSLPGSSSQAYLGVPVEADGRLFGVLEVASPGPGIDPGATGSCARAPRSWATSSACTTTSWPSCRTSC
jgi:GAF domain-containing protein